MNFFLTQKVTEPDFSKNLYFFSSLIKNRRAKFFRFLHEAALTYSFKIFLSLLVFLDKSFLDVFRPK